MCASRELEEEIGYTSECIEKICSMYTAVGFSDEKLHLYMATGLKEGKQNLDEDEFVEVVSYSIEEAVQMIFDGTIQDSKTIVGILAVQNKLKALE